MSGSIGSYVLSLYPGSGGSSSADLLQTIYGGGPGAASSTDVVSALKSAETNSAKDISQTAAQPATARDIAAFNKALAAATTPAQLLQNPTVLKVLLTANGLGDQVGNTALAQKALLSDTKDAKSLANQLGASHAAWKTTASTFDFFNQGLAVLKKPGVAATITNGYAEVRWRQSLDATTPGLSNALSFRSKASTVASVDQILGDSTLRTVVTTALGIPPQIAFQTLGAQEQAISSRLDLAKLKDPKFVETFATRYLLAAQANASNSGGAGQSLDALAASARGLVV